MTGVNNEILKITSQSRDPHEKLEFVHLFRKFLELYEKWRFTSVSTVHHIDPHI
jgi:hypothetical protein